MIYLLAVFSILYFIMCWKRLDWALMILIFALPSYQLRFQILGIPMTVLELMILMAFFVFIIKDTKFKSLMAGKYKIKDYVENKKKRIPYPFGIEIIMWVIVSFLAVGVAHWSNQAFGIWKAYYFEPILVFILILNVFKPSEKCKIDFGKIIMPLAFSAVLVSLAAVYQKITGQFIFNELWAAEATRRTTGLFSYPNALGLYLGPLVMLFGGYLIFNIQTSKQYPENKIFLYKKLLLSIAILLSLTAIVFARSEGALAGILIASALMCFYYIFDKFKLRKVNKYLTKNLVWFVVIFIIISPLFFLRAVPEYKYFNFKNNGFNYISDKLLLKDLSGEIRKQQWRETWQMFEEEGQWLLGSGLSGYQEAVKKYHQEGIFFNWERDVKFRDRIVWWDEKYKSEHWQPVEIYMYPHNLILNFWVELGLVGVLIFIWLVIKFLNLGFRLLAGSDEYKFLIMGLMGSILVLLIHGLVDVPYFKNDLAVVFWLLVALISLLNLSITNPNKKHAEK